MFLFDPTDYRADIFIMADQLRQAGNKIELFLSQRLMDNDVLDTGECLLSTLPANKKEKYKNIIIPLTADHIGADLVSGGGEDPLYEEIRKAVAKGMKPIVVYPERWLKKGTSYAVSQKRREMLSNHSCGDFASLTLSSLREESTVHSDGTSPMNSVTLICLSLNNSFSCSSTIMRRFLGKLSDIWLLKQTMDEELLIQTTD